MTTLASSKFAEPEWRETSEKKAERILAEELARRGWEPQRLEELCKHLERTLQLREPASPIA